MSLLLGVALVLEIRRKKKRLTVKFLSVPAVKKKRILSENECSDSGLLGRRNSNKLYHVYKHLYKVLPYV